jgi:uncharacterized OB-fold protein
MKPIKKSAKIALRLEQEILDEIAKTGSDISEFFREAVKKQLQLKKCPTCGNPIKPSK